MTRIAGGFLVVVFCLTGCGGGGSGGGGGSSPTQLTVIAPTAISSSSLTQGSANSGSTGNYGFATSISMDSTSGTVALSGVSAQLHPKGHLTDVGATTAWSRGWTGNGKNIAILDDFSDTIAVYAPITLTRTATETGYDSATFPRNAVTVTGTYSIDYKAKFDVTHGELVSNIAGGDASAASTNANYDFDADTVTEINCDLNGSVWLVTSCDHDASTWYWDDTTTAVISNKVAGVAKDATMIHSSIDLSSGNTTTLTSAGAKFNNLASGNHVINLSLGLGWASGVTWSDIESGWEANSFASYFNATDAVVVVAAGNSGASCASNDMANCNAIATVLTLDSDTADEAIVAGALDAAGSGIATYSNQAGTLKQRYLMASGETGYKQQSDNSSVSGTSFSAPRISGAAAIVRQKFPNLTGKQTASILLLTADKDIDGNGIDEFSGVSDVFGHGKLDLGTALSPVGSLGIH